MIIKEHIKHFLKIKTFKRQPFTLMEIMIVLSIIVMIAGVIGINARKALRDQRFKGEVSKFVDRLRLAQDLMLIANADIHVKVEANEQKKEITYWIETDYPFPKNFERFIKKVSTFKTINHISHSSGKNGCIDLKFLSRGSTMSSGNIQLSSGSKDKPKNLLLTNIMLHGYPSPIFSNEKNVKEDENSIEAQETHLTQSIIRQIHAIQN